MRIRKDGQQYLQDRNIQDQGAYTIDGRDVVISALVNLRSILNTWRGEWSGTAEENRLREDIENYLALLRRNNRG
jgi:hypothetical protein